MSKVIVLLLILAVAGGLVWLLSGGGSRIGKHSRSRPKSLASATRITSQLPAGASQLEKMRESGVFWGVSLQNPGCDAAMEILDKGIPLTEAPELPLSGCDATQCTCSWKGLIDQRHTNRRTDHDRRDGVRFEHKDKGDRRSHHDRRKSAGTWDRRDF